MKRVFILLVLLVLSTMQLTSCMQKADQPVTAKSIQLFNGENLDGWYTFLSEQGRNADTTDHIFSVKDGMLHILGKVNGYICTENAYDNYTLTVEFKWGEQKFVPEDKERNSGILYHFAADSKDRVWPHAIECQLMHGNMGDYVLMGPTMVINGEQGGTDKRVFAKSEDGEKPVGEWNTVQVITNGATSKHVVNGKVVNQGIDASVQKGKILIQSEGAELWVRKVELVPHM